MTNQSPRMTVGRPRGFTLVELLVVIGIIAVLIGILLPSLNAARRSGLKTACAAKLQQIMLAAQVHRTVHKEYVPLAGVIPGCLPENLNDPDSKKYDYLSFNIEGAGRPICTLPLGLETQMANSRAINAAGVGVLGSQNGNQLYGAYIDPHGLSKFFICPAQCDGPLEVIPQQVIMYAATAQLFGLYQPQSYIYNEVVVGWNDGKARLRGRIDRVRQPSVTMFAADGTRGADLSRDGVAGQVGMYTVYNKIGKAPVTMADVLQDGAAGDSQSFDHKRHAERINVAFCDGHVETRSITATDLRKIYLLAP